MSLQECINELKQALPQEAVLLDEPMAKHTTFKIGGPADCFVMPSTIDEAVTVIKTIHKYNVPLTMIGNGSNLLVMDKGIRGVVVNLNERFSKIEQKGNLVYAQCGALMADVSKFAGSCSLTGLEFAVGIPGSIGGCIFMNAGAYDGEIKNAVKSVTELAFGDKEAIEAKMADLTARREAKQPLELPSAGSTFKRPPGYFAGTLIDQTGLKGLTVGGAQVSTKHAGFVVNIGGATAQNVLDLIAQVQQRVYEKHGVKLYPEVKMIGEQ